MSLVFDEYGRPFIIMREGQQEQRLKGLEAQKANIQVRPLAPVVIAAVTAVGRECSGPTAMLRACLRLPARQRAGVLTRSAIAWYDLRPLVRRTGGEERVQRAAHVAWPKGDGQDAQLARW